MEQLSADRASKEALVSTLSKELKLLDSETKTRLADLASSRAAADKRAEGFATELKAKQAATAAF